MYIPDNLFEFFLWLWSLLYVIISPFGNILWIFIEKYLTNF